MAHHPALAISFAQRSDTGRQRRSNEDTSTVHEVVIKGRRAVVAAIADGMGGAQAGAHASQLAVRVVTQSLLERLRDAVPADEIAWQRMLCEALHAANAAVHQRSSGGGSLAGMGTTLLVSVVWERRVRIAHIGDCRAYMVRPAVRRPHIMQLTADHTVVAEMITTGALTRADASTHPQRHQLARSIGAEAEIEPELIARNLRMGERLLLCTDGLTLHVSDAELARAVSDAPTPQRACDQLVELANQRGGRDNVTVVILAADRDELA